MPKPSRQVAVIGSIVVLALAIVVVTQWIIVRSLDSGTDDLARSTYFVIEPSESVDSIADRLHEEGLIRSPGFFHFLVRVAGDGDDIVAGRYRLDTAMSTTQIIRTITSEDAALVQEVSVQFIEGWRSEQYAEALVQAGLIDSVDEFVEATHDPRWNEQFIFLHTRPRGVGLEGYLFPDTYNFRMDSTADDIIEKLLANFGERVTPEMIARADALGITLHQAITLASIVEREAVSPEERPVIASVFYNRLAQGMPLAADPTIQYEHGAPGNWWPEVTPEAIQQDGLYNTYLNPDLPPAPIANPGLASIESALYPAETPYLFFVAKGDGTHAFAETFEEHEKNIDLYQ